MRFKILASLTVQTASRSLIALLLKSQLTVTEISQCRTLLNQIPSLVTTPNPHYGSALHIAARHGNLEAIKCLHHAGADRNARDKDNITPLHILALNGHLVSVAYLINQPGTHINATDNDGITPLHIAAWQGHHKIAHILMFRGAQVNAKSQSGNTPLHVATRFGHLSVVKQLLETNASITDTDDTGKTALEIAQTQATKRPELYRYLEEETLLRAGQQRCWLDWLLGW